MELAIPLVALGGLYVISNNRSPNNVEGMQGLQSSTDEERQDIINNLSHQQVNENIMDDQNKFMNIDNPNYLDNLKKSYNGKQTTDEFFNISKLIEPINVPGNNNFANENNHMSLTGEPINDNNFKHNNMQPFYREKTLTSSQSGQYDKIQPILDNRIGTGSLQMEKRSNAPLFSPSSDMHHANGMPNMNDFLQSRVNPANKISNVLPFDTKRVGPGLDQGFGTQGSNGFNSGMMARDKWMPRDVDELRVATNPKVTYSLDGHAGPANSHIKNRGYQAAVEKNRPDRHFETGGKDSWFTTVGQERAQTARSIANVHSDIRENTSSAYEGVARGANRNNLGESKIQETRRIQLAGGQLGIADAGGHQPANSNSNNVDSFNIYENNRTANSQKGKFGGVGGALGAVIAPLMDVLRPSRRENVTGNVRLYGEIQAEVPASYINNPNDRVRTTNRQMTSNDDMFLNVQTDGRASYKRNDQSLGGNQRDTTQQSYIGNAGGSGVSNSMTTYDTAYKQTNNESKEVLVQNRVNQGGTQMFNQNINLSVNRDDEDRQNNRMFVPSNANVVPPSSQTFGKLDQPGSYFEEKNNNDRINPDLLKAFKQNPYTHSLNSSI